MYIQIKLTLTYKNFFIESLKEQKIQKIYTIGKNKVNYFICINFILREKRLQSLTTLKGDYVIHKAE